jgi:hypothetical protein
MVSLITPARLLLSVSKSVSSRSLAEKASRVSRVVLASVEATVDKGLDAASQWVEECRYHEGGDRYGELWLLGLVRQRAEDRLGRRHAPK